MNKKPRVVIAVDQNISRALMEMLVRACLNYELVAALRTVQEAARFADSHETDIMILDMMMQTETDCITAIKQIKEKHSEIKIILGVSGLRDDRKGKTKDASVDDYFFREDEDRSILEIMDGLMPGSRNPQ